jgi:hypothetical protein
MKRTLLFILPALFLGACATVSSPVPEGYKGPTVQLSDSGFSESGGKGVFFSAIAVDGREIENSLRETRGASYGKGFSLSSRYTSREVPVTPMKVKLIGTHQTGAPIHEMAARMAGTFFSVEGVADFKPAEGRSYVVTGELKKEQSCVWIEDMQSKQASTEKVCTK